MVQCSTPREVYIWSTNPPTQLIKCQSNQSLLIKVIWLMQLGGLARLDRSKQWGYAPVVDKTSIWPCPAGFGPFHGKCAVCFSTPLPCANLAFIFKETAEQTLYGFVFTLLDQAGGPQWNNTRGSDWPETHFQFDSKKSKIFQSFLPVHVGEGNSFNLLNK